MAAPANILSTVNAVGNREDLSGVISRISPTATPFLTRAGKAKASANYHEWMTSEVDAPNADNAAVEGNDPTMQAATARKRLGNICQIFERTGVVSKSQSAVSTAGITSDLADEKVSKMLALKTDIEARYVSAKGSAHQNGTVGRQAAGILAFAESNTFRGTNGADGGFDAGTGLVAAPTNGTLRDLSEAHFEAAMESLFTKSGQIKPVTALMGAGLKAKASKMVGNADRQLQVSGAKGGGAIVGGAAVYLSDFGDVALVPTAIGLTRDVLIFDEDMVADATLRGAGATALGVTGDNDKFLINYEGTLVVKNEKAIAVIADVQ